MMILAEVLQAGEISLYLQWKGLDIVNLPSGDWFLEE
jgi:hypothetical protein